MPKRQLPVGFRGRHAMSHIIVVGNEKGGAGKSTVSMHVATALSRLGKSVAVIDLDLRQKTLARFLENRLAFLLREGMDLPTPDYQDLPEIAATDLAPGENANDRRLSDAVTALEGRVDFIVIDCPGSHTRLAQVAHSLADTLITPMNDSYIDFDLLARVDPVTNKVQGPSVYAEMVWNARQLRAQAGLKPIDWVVVRNRMGAQAMVNKKKIGEALEALSKRIGFRIAPGFCERVIFRELFPRGLTLLDLRDIGVMGTNISNVAARQELRDLMKELHLPGVSVTF
jgi:chromosome partitioning protein